MSTNMMDYPGSTNSNLHLRPDSRPASDTHMVPSLDSAPFGYQFVVDRNQPPSPGYFPPAQNHILQAEQRLQYEVFLDGFNLNGNAFSLQVPDFANDQEPPQVLNVEGVGMTYGHPGSYPIGTPTAQHVEASPFDQMYQFGGISQAATQFVPAAQYDFNFNAHQHPTISRPSSGPFYSPDVQTTVTSGSRLRQTQHMTEQRSLGFGSDAAFEHNGYTAPAGHSEDAVTGSLQGVMDALERDRSYPNSNSVSPMMRRRSSPNNTVQKSPMKTESSRKSSKVRKLSSPAKKTIERRARLTTEEKKERHTQSEKRRRETIGGSRKALYDLIRIEKSTQHDELGKVIEFFYGIEKGIKGLQALVGNEPAASASLPIPDNSTTGRQGR